MHDIVQQLDNDKCLLYTLIGLENTKWYPIGK